MTRNGIYVFTTILTVVILVLGYQLYQERHETSGLQINVGGKTISIETR